MLTQENGLRLIWMNSMSKDKVNIKELVGTTWGKIDERAVKYKTSWLYKFIGKKYYDSVCLLLIVLGVVYFFAITAGLSYFFGKTFAINVEFFTGIIVATWLMSK